MLLKKVLGRQFEITAPLNEHSISSMWSIIIITWGRRGLRGASVLPTMTYTDAQPESGFFCLLFALFLSTWGLGVNLVQLLPFSHACMVFDTNPCNFEIFKTVMKYFLKHYRAQISYKFILDSLSS